MNVELPNGFYVVVKDDPRPGKSFCAGFVVEDGRVVQCADIVRARWKDMPEWLRLGCVRYVGP